MIMCVQFMTFKLGQPRYSLYIIEHAQRGSPFFVEQGLKNVDTLGVCGDLRNQYPGGDFFFVFNRK